MVGTTITINPATGDSIAEYKRIYSSEALLKVAQAKETYKRWKTTTLTDRTALMHQLADVLEQNKEEYAQLITSEMGKPIVQARKEIEKCVWICRYYADNTKTLLANETIETEAEKSYVTFQPIGVVLAVMPWNFLLSGNTFCSTSINGWQCRCTKTCI